MDAPEKEWRREDGAHKKVHLRTVENPRWQSEPRSVLIFLFLVEDIGWFCFGKNSVDTILRIDRYDFIYIRVKAVDQFPT